MNKKEKTMIGVVLVSVFMITISISYAYFTATFQNLGVRETTITASTMGSLKLTSTEATYTSGNQYPGDMAIQKFTVEPVSKGSGVYELDLTGVIDESIFGTDVEIQLYKSIDNTEVTITEGDLTQEGENYSRVDTLVTNGLNPIYTGTLKNGLNILYQEEFEVIEESGTLKVRENSESTSYPKYTFYLVYNYKNNGNQNIQMGSTFSGTVSGKMIQEKRKNSAETILSLAPDADPTSTVEIDNGTDASGCTNTLAYDDYGNLRYVGDNPCNYVTFNEETADWRIIGVFDNKLKLIKNDSIGTYAWDSSEDTEEGNAGFGINQWGESRTYTGADLMKLLNPGYETNLAEDSSGNTISGTYANNSLYWNKQSGNCYSNSKNAKSSCDFSSIGLTQTAKNMIDKSTWYLGSQGTNNVNSSGNGLGLAKKFYEYERSNNTGKICSPDIDCADLVNRTTTWVGYVGLMYPSDYGYAVGGVQRNNCLENINLYNYGTSNCISNNWLRFNEVQYTITPYADITDSRGMFSIGEDGMVDNNVTINTYNFAGAVRPSVYLKSNVMITGGEGTPTNPYVLSLN
ncbi:MAG: hypothetical protein IJ743_05260 [Bacilli bacterium]|nr:hypothetical protein [Bacilli bacterium]